MTYSIIISTKDRLSSLKALLESIKKHTESYEIRIVDDVSEDGTGKWITDHITKEITYMRNEETRSVAEAWNQGAEGAIGKYLIFLNYDMLVTAGWAEHQREMWENFPLIGSLAFKVYDDQWNVQSRGHSFDGLNPYLPVFEEDEVLEDDVPSTYPMGLLFAVDYSDHPFTTMRNFEKVGGFTAHGHMYYEDADFGLKLQSKGLFNYYNPKAVLIHKTVGLRTGNKRDKKRRAHNESTVQQEAKVSFYKSWGEYLKNRI